jgi:flagellar basal body-associated protein FliL
MPKTNIKSFKFFKLMLLMLCVVIVLTVITVGLVILWSQKSKESTPKEKDINSIYHLLKISIFICQKVLFVN